MVFSGAFERALKVMRKWGHLETLPLLGLLLGVFFLMIEECRRRLHVLFMSTLIVWQAQPVAAVVSLLLG